MALREDDYAEDAPNKPRKPGYDAEVQARESRRISGERVLDTTRRVERAKRPWKLGEEKHVRAKRLIAAGLIDPRYLETLDEDNRAELTAAQESASTKEVHQPSEPTVQKEAWRGFARVPYVIIDQLGPIMPASVAWAYVCCVRWMSFTTGNVTISQQQLGKFMGQRSRESGKRAVRMLRDAGLIEVVKRGGMRDAGYWTPSEYKVVKNPNLAKARAVFEARKRRKT